VPAEYIEGMRLRTCASVALTAALVACSSKSSDPVTQPPDPVCTKEKKGNVTLAIDAEPVLQSTASAAFSDDLLATPTSKCTQTTMGACLVTECTKLPDPPAGTKLCIASTTSAAAGAIDISGGKNPALTLTSDKKRSYPSVNSAGSRWAAGDNVKVSAPGGDVPAFDATLVFPDRVVVTGPTAYVDKTDPIVLDWKAGFTITWTKATGTVLVRLLQGDAGLHKKTLMECKAPSADGTLTIPSDALAVLEGSTTTTQANATLDVYGTAIVQLKAGEFDVTVQALFRELQHNVVVKLDGVPAK